MENPVPVTPLPAPVKKKTGAIIATIATAVLCGCPGLAGACWGGLSAIISFIPGANIDIGGSSDPNTALMWGIGALCGGLIFVAIPVVVGIVTLKKKKEPAVTELPPSEPLPPAA